MSRAYEAIDLARERAVLVGVIDSVTPEETVQEHLEELAFLVRTAGASAVKTFVQKLDRPDSRTFVGKGKWEEIRTWCTDQQINLIIFDEELSPSQLRNLERDLPKGIRIMDRSGLILDIFAGRARTAQAKLQVELAQYQYLLPRLTRMWTHLERQKGGIGLRGPGETELETDRRVINDRIALLKDKLKALARQDQVRRKQRSKMIRVALVGYTNVGKSTLMNALTKSQVFAENKLFATLDTTVRKTAVDNIPFLLSDTVGFIRKLPHHLIESFKSTLDEAREADILLHVIDISHAQYQEQIQVVEETLKAIGAKPDATIMVFNKMDRYTPEEWAPEPAALAGDKQKVFISALKKDNLEELRSLVAAEVRRLYLERYPYQKAFYYPDQEQ